MITFAKYCVNLIYLSSYLLYPILYGPILYVFSSFDRLLKLSSSTCLFKFWLTFEALSHLDRIPFWLGKQWSDLLYNAHVNLIVFSSFLPFWPYSILSGNNSQICCIFCVNLIYLFKLSSILTRWNDERVSLDLLYTVFYTYVCVLKLLFHQIVFESI